VNLLTGDLWTLYVADCREAMAAMPERSVHCVVSSPPYWGLRDYGIPPVDWQDGDRCVFGLEKTIAAYIRHTIDPLLDPDSLASHGIAQSIIQISYLVSV